MTMRFAIYALFCALLVFGGPAFAVSPDEKLKDPALEARAREVSADLRCLVCQNQSIDDSDATLARDLRILVRERIKAGDDNDQVKQFLVDRYGEFVLLRPRMGGHTLLLWLSPLVVLGLGAIAVFIGYRKRNARKVENVQGLTAQEEEKLKKILSDDI